MSATNDAIFDRLVKSAADHEGAIPDGNRRIFLKEDDFKVVADSKRCKHFPIARRQAAALLRTSEAEYLIVFGFESENFTPTSSMREVELTPGLAVAAIADLEIEPNASSSEIFNVVAAGSSIDRDYGGHEWTEVLRLFPRLRAIEVDADAGSEGAFLANLLSICAAEGAGGNGWINDQLADELARLSEQRIAGFPYEFLVMATLDLDPKNLFLALYRCLEATYAFTRSSELALKLDIKEKSWFEVAQALGESLSWYPRHDQSLTAILSLPAVRTDDLAALALSLGRDHSGDEVANRVAAGIRDLRNSLVHYGPTTPQAGVPGGDWNRLCAPLARVVGDVFAHTYGGVESRSSFDVASAVESEPTVAIGAGGGSWISRRSRAVIEWIIRRYS